MQPITTSPDTFAPPCFTQDLHLLRGPRSGEEAEQNTVVFRLINHGTHGCYLTGYPSAMLYDRVGHKLQVAVEDRGDQMITSAGPRVVELARGGSAYLAINKNSCEERDRDKAATITFGMPDGLPLSIALSPASTLWAADDATLATRWTQAHSSPHFARSPAFDFTGLERQLRPSWNDTSQWV